MERLDFVIPYCNGITYYFKNWVRYFANDEVPINEKMNKKYVLNALLSMLSFDIIFNKETLVEKKENCNYESKIHEEDIDDLLDLFNNANKNVTFSSGAELLSFIRNKIAHGDLKVNYDQNKILFNRENEIIIVDIDEFLRKYLNLSSIDKLRIKQNKFTKEKLLCKTLIPLNKPVESKQELEDLLCPMRVKNYSISRVDGKELEESEIIEFCQFIDFILAVDPFNQYKNEENMIDGYLQRGYIVDIRKNKVKNHPKMNEIKQSVENNTKIYNMNKNKISLNELTYKYHDDIYKIIKDDYQLQSINMGIKINEDILSNMYFNNIFDIKKALKGIKYGGYISEIMASIDLARFYTLYCYPLEKIYTKDHNYHYDRDDEFRFDFIDMSEFNPNILEINEKGKIEIDNKINSIIKKINGLNNKIDRLEKNIIGISSKKNIDSNLLNKVKEFKKMKDLSEEQLSKCYELYQEMYGLKELIYNDYKNNSLYFRNRQIIEGMRNAISHGNVYLTDIGLDINPSDIKIKFSDIYDGNIEFEMTTSLYNLENLFEEENIKNNNEFILKKLKK